MSEQSNSATQAGNEQREAERLALVLINDDRAAAGLQPVSSRDTIPDSDGYVRNAQAILAALRPLPATDAVREALEGFIADLTGSLRNPETMLTISHDGLRSRIDQGRAALAQSPAPAQDREALRQEIINTPETADFMDGVPLEAAHQRERWGADHDAGKSPFDWFWLIGYLAQKAADAAVRGDAEKAKHHTISTAAALANWHAALTGADTSMRPGIDPVERNAA